MSGYSTRGTTDDELFLTSPSTSSAPPLVPPPLRINKRFGADHSQESLVESPLPYPTGRRPSGVPSSSGSPAPTQLPYPDRPASERIAFAQQQLQQSPQLPYPDRERPVRTSSPASSTTSSPSLLGVSSHPSRHVSVSHSDEYPTPPPFKHRDSGRPARLGRQNTLPQDLPPQGSQKEESPSPDKTAKPYAQFQQQYWPPPSRMTSTSTTAARRGSPPPPETPATATSEYPPMQIGAVNVPQRHDSPSLSSTGAQGRNTPQSSTYTAFSPPQRPWTPTETPGSYPHGPPTVWHGTGGEEQEQVINGHIQQEQAIESDFQRMHLSSSPPPSYASLSHQAPATASSSTTAQGFPDEKRTVVVGAAAPPELSHASHPAFHNDPLPAQQSPVQPQQRQQQQEAAPQPQQQQPQQQPQQRPQPPPSQQIPQPQQTQQQQQVQHQAHQQGQQVQQQQVQQQQVQQQQVQQQQVQQQQVQQQQQIQQQPFQQQQSFPQEQYIPTQQMHPHQEQHFTPPPTVGPSSPPPLPEGWMAHVDPASGQYYYIHIPTSRTQWEFPAPETISPPISSPALSNHSYANIPPLGSPGFPPSIQSYHDPAMGVPPSMMHPNTYPMQSYHDPAMGVPPSMMHPNTYPMHTPPPQLPMAGINVFSVAPSNGEYFGPYLRYTNMDIENGVWLGSVMIVTGSPQPPTVHIHQSLDISPNPRQLKGNLIFIHKTWTFYRYDIDIQMGDLPAKWTYAITSNIGCTRFEFLVAGRHDRNWRFIAHSCNGFSLSVKDEEKMRLGGVGYMWKDVMMKHMETGGFHAQIGGGDQIYADRLWREIPLLKNWLEIKGKENRKNAPWTTTHEEDVNHAYFHYYSSHFDQPYLREAWAQIPHLLQVDDHDIFDGFGSYPEYMQFSNMFKNIGRIAIHWYLVFQHHTTLDILHSTPDERDLFTITGTGWHFIKYLGPAVVVVGIDTRSERNQYQVMAGPTYQGLFPKIATLPPSVQHCILMLAVPIIYPRLDTAEHVVNTVATGKKAVTGTYNLLGKVVGSAAGVVGAKQVVGTGFESVKKAFGKSGLMSSVVSVFGEVDLLDDLRDHWTHESKDLERTYLIRTLQGISLQRGLRMTFISGDVHCCGAGLVHDPSKPSDYKTMYQIISSAIVNVPPPNMVLKLLHNNKALYVPQNGMRSTHFPSDTKEDMIELFQTDVNGQSRELKKLMGRRNYVIFCAYDAGIGMAGGPGPLSLAVDFIVQGESAFSNTFKYGPVVIPRVERTAW